MRVKNLYRGYPIAVLSSPTLTTPGLYDLQEINWPYARQMLREYQYVSHVVDASMSKELSQLLEADIVHCGNPIMSRAICCALVIRLKVAGDPTDVAGDPTDVFTPEGRYELYQLERIHGNAFAK